MIKRRARVWITSSQVLALKSSSRRRWRSRTSSSILTRQARVPKKQTRSKLTWKTCGCSKQLLSRTLSKSAAKRRRMCRQPRRQLSQRGSSEATRN